MDDKELKLLIPSKYVRKHIKSVGWEFSDRERVAVMMNSDHFVNLKFDYLKNLCNNTTDKELKTQIDLWLNWVVKIYEKFVQNEDGKFVYDFYREGKELSGNMYYKYACHFNNWHDAYQNAMDMQWEFNFRITKSPISFTLEEEENNGHYISFSDLKDEAEKGSAEAQNELGKL